MRPKGAAMRFHLGTDNPSWLWREQPTRHPLFVSTRRLNRYAAVKAATVDWALDSGGFTELNMYGTWKTTPEEYVHQIRRYAQIGRMQWASQQDWMCETFVLATTGKTVAEHQRLTIDNLLQLRHLAADLPIIPVLQGWTIDDYLRHVDQFNVAGIDLTAEPIVGIGSVCRRADVGPIGDLIVRLADEGIKLHGFGIKQDGIRRYGFALASADSMAWSFTARRAPGVLCNTNHRSPKCTHCPDWAQRWADNVIANSNLTPFQMSMSI
jgi:hypothetical protein